jgi:hypothetical protein
MGNCFCQKIRNTEKENEIQEKQAIIPYIERKLSNHYSVRYPIHEKRKNSAIYNSTHHELIHVRNLPCFICGKHNSSSSPLETHHFYCEKSAQNAIDWRVFGEFANHCYNIQTGDCIGTRFVWTEVEKTPDIFVDSVYNMIVLCKEHHISGGRGIHHVPFPDWILQKYPKDGFEFLTIN